MKNLFAKAALLSLFVLLFSYNTVLASPIEAQNFIEKISKDALDVIKSKDADNQKEKKLTDLFINFVDTKWIARFAIGKYWNEATEDQKNKYVEMHKKFLLRSYIPKFKEYNNQQVKITKSYADGEGEYMVESKMISGDGEAINVDYKIRKNESGKYMIFDVIAEGVSLITTQRSDFASILSREGVDSLIKKLGAKS